MFKGYVGDICLRVPQNHHEPQNWQERVGCVPLWCKATPMSSGHVRDISCIFTKRLILAVRQRPQLL